MTHLFAILMMIACQGRAASAEDGRVAGDAALNAGRFGAAREAYSGALRANPGDCRAGYGLGLALYHLGRWDESLAALRAARRACAADAALARLEDEVARRLRQAADRRRRAELMAEGVALFRAKRPAEAADKFAEALKLGDTAACRFNLALARFEAGDMAAALAGAQECLKRSPAHAGAGYLLGRIYQKAGLMGPARDWMRFVVARNDPHFSGKAARCLEAWAALDRDWGLQARAWYTRSQIGVPDLGGGGEWQSLTRSLWGAWWNPKPGGLPMSAAYTGQSAHANLGGPGAWQVYHALALGARPALLPGLAASVTGEEALLQGEQGVGYQHHQGQALLELSRPWLTLLQAGGKALWERYPTAPDADSRSLIATVQAYQVAGGRHLMGLGGAYRDAAARNGCLGFSSCLANAYYRWMAQPSLTVSYQCEWQYYPLYVVAGEPRRDTIQTLRLECAAGQARGFELFYGLEGSAARSSVQGLSKATAGLFAGLGWKM